MALDFRMVIHRFVVYFIILTVIFLVLCIISVYRHRVEISAILQSSILATIDSVAVIIMILMAIIWLIKSIF